MAKVGVIYFSGTGTTARLAESVIEGAKEAGADALDLPIQPSDISEGRWVNDEQAAQLDSCHANFCHLLSQSMSFAEYNEKRPGCRAFSCR